MQIPPIKRIAVLTGGGDAPGLNAVLRAVVKSAVGVHGWSVLGVENGYEGLIGDPQVRRLTPDDVRGLLPRGGTILGTSNRGHFTHGSTRGVNAAALDDALANLNKLGVDALVTIGGDGTQTIAAHFHARGVPVVGVPKTIDNDLVGTDQTFGFNSALEMATDAIDRLHTTAASHGRCMVLEVMGRTAGWIALHAAIAGGADAVLLPEIPFQIDRIADAIARRDALGRRFSIVVAAEGAQPFGGEAIFAEAASPSSNARFGGIGDVVGRALAQTTGKETRVVVLGHLQRGGQPTAYDRLLATEFGVAAVGALAEGKSGVVVVLKGSDISTIAIDLVAGRCKTVPHHSPLLRAAVALGIEIGCDPAILDQEDQDGEGQAPAAPNRST